MGIDDSHSEKLAVITGYQANRAERFAVWLAWAVGILKQAVVLRPDDEGLEVMWDTLKVVLKKSRRDIFRLVVTADVDEAAQGHAVVLSGRTSIDKVVTGILGAKSELTPEDLTGLGLGEMGEAARDRLCEKVNAVLFRPHVDLPAPLESRLLNDLVKALEELGEEEAFKDALRDAARSGDCTALAGLLDRQGPEADEDLVEPDAPDLGVIQVGSAGVDACGDDPGPLAA